MTRPRCEVCGCPMRRGPLYAECRPCALDVDAPGAARLHLRGGGYDWAEMDLQAFDRRVARSTWSPADANDTANTAATSWWLPPGANDPTMVRGGTMAIAAAMLDCSFAAAYQARRWRHPPPPSLPKAGDP